MHVILPWIYKVKQVRGYARINPKLVGERLLSHIENLDIFQSHLNCKGYSCHQRLLSTWYIIIHMIQ
jgi:hypothetical protein